MTVMNAVLKRHERRVERVRLRLRELSWRNKLHPQTVNFVNAISAKTGKPVSEIMKSDKVSRYDRRVKNLE